MSPGLGTAGSTLCPSRRCLSGSCPQAHPGLPQFAGQLPCSLPASVCPAHCPASLWDTSVAPEPLNPVELDKTELLPIQHSLRWQKDTSKVMQGRRAKLQAGGTGCTLTSCADFRALSGPVSRDDMPAVPSIGVHCWSLHTSASPIPQPL